MNEELVLQKAEVINCFLPLATRFEASKIVTANSIYNKKTQKTNPSGQSINIIQVSRVIKGQSPKRLEVAIGRKTRKDNLIVPLTILLRPLRAFRIVRTDYHLAPVIVT